VLDSCAVQVIQDVRKAKQINEIISYAKTFLGTPYKYSGTTPSGFDCSGFIGYVMGKFGLTIPRTSYSIAELGKTIKLADVQPGDLLFFKGRNLNSSQVGHIAMVVEANENEIIMIHAASRGVVTENFKTSKYYIPRFIKAKRMNYTLPSLQ
jgi:cell wall-associated NlpC family hydrolase